MPPRFAYWTILIDNRPTAFRARDPQELLPTLNQLKRTNKDVAMKWFARGRLWETQQQERDDFQRRKRSAERRPQQRRDRDWRPGGDHKDPRARFDKKTSRAVRRERQASKPGKPGGRPDRDRGRSKPRHDGRSRESDRARRETVRAKAPRERFPRHDRPEPRPTEPRPTEPRPTEPPVRRAERPSEAAPEPPPAPEQIVIKPEPPERG